jgi:hypothetical protein
MKWMVNGIVVDDAELRRLNLPIAGDCITKQCGNDKTEGDGKFLPPPTYKGLSEEMAQRLNKVLEESHKSNVKYLEIMTKRLKDMEERKTKKMTKVEAFEYLKNKNVAAKGMVKGIQKKLFEIGYTWCDGSTDVFVFVGFFLIDDETFQFTESLSHFKNCAYEELSADDILSIEIVDEKKKSEEEEALDKIRCLGAQIVDILLRMKGHHHVTITETTVALHDEGMCLFHSDPF